MAGAVVEDDGDVAKDDLLPTGFDRESCLSRHQPLLYRRKPVHGASPSLISKLRSYEVRHKRCGPHTDSYSESVRALQSGTYTASSSDSGCNYVVWVPVDGLGNRILTLASAFLYALLTDRVLLLDRGTDVGALFCEPFPEASWLLPPDFPFGEKFRSFDWWSHQTYGEMLKDSNSTAPLSQPQPYIFLNLLYFNNDHDRRFFCDQDQAYLQKIPWLVIKANVYFVPSFFLMTMFQEELDRLFPDKERVFHLLARYLLHPTNSVWGLVTRYYDAYLSDADTTVGIQVRVLGGDSSPGLFTHLFAQIVSCIEKGNVLPEIGPGRPSGKQSKNRVAVVMTSLTSGYSEGLRDMYLENSTVTGDVVAVFQPSNEGRQQTDKANHDEKAWAEMYLLSLTDNLVTSSWSTFGYVAQGIGGLRPWILDLPNNQTTPDPPCLRGVSMEPCFHSAPRYTCGTRTRADAAVPHVGPCEDRPWDIKLFHA